MNMRHLSLGTYDFLSFFFSFVWKIRLLSFYDNFNYRVTKAYTHVDAGVI